MSGTIDKLRTTTVEARERIALERETELAKEEEQRRQEERKQELLAEQVIGQINARANTEALEGRNHAIIMSIDYEDYNRPRDEDWQICKPEWLHGAAATVYEHCVREGFNPTIEFWHDGVGVKSGFNIIVHW